MEFLPLIWWALSGLVNLLFAYEVGRDANAVLREGRTLTFGPVVLWFLATLIGGPLVAGVYWVIHRSRIRQP